MVGLVSQIINKGKDFHLNMMTPAPAPGLVPLLPLALAPYHNNFPFLDPGKLCLASFTIRQTR